MHLPAAGLTHATAFHFEAPGFTNDGTMVAGTVMTLPYTRDYFLAVHPATSPKAGHLAFGKIAPLRVAFAQAAKTSNLQKTIAQEKLVLPRRQHHQSVGN